MLNYQQIGFNMHGDDGSSEGLNNWFAFALEEDYAYK